MRIQPFKILAVFLIVFGLLMTMGLGCKGPSAAQVAATKPVALEYWTVFDDVDALREQINKYKEARPYLTITLRQLRPEEFYNRLVEALAEDKGPDIISIRNRAVRELEGKLAPMPASVMDTTVTVTQGTIGKQTNYNTQSRALIDINRLDKEYVQTVRKDVVIGNKIYGLPLSLDNMAVYYNKDILDRSGVPEPPKNWTEFQAAVKKITKYNKQTGKIAQAGAAFGTGSNMPGADDLLYILFKQSDLDFTNKNGAAVFNLAPGNSQGETPAMTVMNFYTDFANATRDTYTWNENMDSALDSFVNGSVGFFFGYSYHYAMIKARAPQLNFAVIPMLQIDAERPVNAANYWVQSVVGKSKNQNEAWALVDFLTHSKAVKEYLDKTVRPTALRAYISEQSDKPELAPFVAQALVSDNWYRGKNYDAALKAVNNMIHEWLGTPPSPNEEMKWRQDILNRAASKVNQTM